MAERALVTGAYGFVGRYVARALAAQGAHVIGIGHGNWGRDEWRRWGVAEWHTADVTVDTLTTYAGEPDTIFHCAGSGSVAFSMTHPHQDWQRTVASTLAVLEYMRLQRPQARLVIPSSAGVYGQVARIPISTQDPLSPASPYGVHKKIAEDLCRSYAQHFGVRSALVRLFSVFGIGIRKQLLWDACTKLSQGRASFGGTGDETRDWLHVEDAAQLMLTAARNASTQCPVVNGGVGEAVRIGDVVGLIAERLGGGVQPEFSGQTRAGDPMHYQADVSGALAWGWVPQRDRVAEMQAYVDWFRNGRPMTRIGFVLSYTDSAWVGGINYLSNLLHAVGRVADRRIEPVLVVAPDTPAQTLEPFAGWPVERSPVAATGNRGWGLARKLVDRGLGCDLLLQGFLKQRGIGLLSHSGQLGARSRFPTIGWLPDFQHCRMPEFFKPEEIAARDRGYRRITDQASTVLLSSVDAQQDLAKFAPEAVAKSRVLHFVPGFASAPVAAADEATLRQRYQIDGPYFHLPNQFWAHKNHRVVIDALALLKAQGRPARVLCTGHTQDRRQPEHFPGLMAHAREQGVEDAFRVLGLVPYEDLAGLMRHAVAVVNPSLFEGWSTTVEESKSLGLRVLLSDIPVHREQSPERGLYFDPRSGQSLASALLQALGEYSPDAEQAHQSAARQSLPARFARFGEQYQAIALDTVARAG